VSAPQAARGERNGYYTRDLITPAGRIAQLRVPRDREGTFLWTYAVLKIPDKMGLR
jgi:transposase-like protein